MDKPREMLPGFTDMDNFYAYGSVFGAHGVEIRVFESPDDPSWCLDIYWNDVRDSVGDRFHVAVEGLESELSAQSFGIELAKRFDSRTRTLK